MDLYPCGCVLQGYLFAARVTGQAVVAAVMLKSSRLVKFVGICMCISREKMTDVPYEA